MLLEKIKLEADEQIVTQVRRHWFVITAQITVLAIAAIVPLILYAVAANQTQSLEAITTALNETAPHMTFLYLLWVCLWFGVFNRWTNYYLDVLTITDRRAIIINQKGFFRRNVASFRLERLQDLNIEINGVIATLLDFGDIHAETAGHDEELFTLQSVPKPRELKARILEATDSRMQHIPQRISSDGV